MLELLFLALGYGMGSVPFGLVIGKAWGSLDIRKYGSGNIGTSNVMRTLGKLPAIIVLLLDVGKGWAPVALAAAYDAPTWVVIGAGVAAVAGHVWSVFLRFDGGKGIATTLGVMIALDPRIAALLVSVWLLTLVITRYISVASLTGALALPILVILFGHPAAYLSGGVVISLLAFWRHRSNIERLRRGTEYRFGERAKPVEPR